MENAFRLTISVFMLYSCNNEEKAHAKKQQKKKTPTRIPKQNEHSQRAGHTKAKKKKREKGSFCMSPPSSSIPLGRLTKTHEYRRVYKKGKLFKGTYLWVYILAGDQSAVRLGISLGRKVVKKATERNRIKRIVKEWLRFNQQGFLAPCQIAVVVKKSPPTNRQGAIKLREEFARALKKRHIISNEGPSYSADKVL